MQEDKTECVKFPLEDVVKLDELETAYPGPTDWTNWALPGRLLVGAYPKKKELTVAILRENITHFICLMTDREVERQGKLYFDFCEDLIRKNKDLDDALIKKLTYIHFPMYDQDVVKDEPTMELVFRILQLLQDGHKVYLHCRGGHGRTGVILSLLFGYIYDFGPYEALELCKNVHRTRADVIKGGYKMISPQTTSQRDQVYRILSKPRDYTKINKK